MLTLKNRALASLKMKRYARECEARKKLEYAMSYPLFNELETRCREAVRTAALGGGKNQVRRLQKERAEFLQSIGLSENEIENTYYCNVCRDTCVADGKQCKCLTAEMSSLLSASGLNVAHSFENSAHNIENNAVFEYCKSYASGKQPKKNILLAGMVGTGKTYLVNAIGNELTRRGENVSVYTAFDLNMLFLRIKLADMSEKYSLWNEILQTDYLLIDDLGTEDAHKGTAASLFNLLNQRLESGKKTIITTNLTLKELLDLYGERIFSRLTDVTNTYAALLKGSDLRHKTGTA